MEWGKAVKRVKPGGEGNSAKGPLSKVIEVEYEFPSNCDLLLLPFAPPKFISSSKYLR